MKKWIRIVCVLMGSLLLATACGKKEEPVKQTAVSEQYFALANDFAAMCDRFNEVADVINADENLLALPGLVDHVNLISDSINQADALFAEPSSINDTIAADLTMMVMECNKYLDQLNSVVENYSGKVVVTIPVEIINETDKVLYELTMSPTASDSWGNNLLETPLDIGESCMVEMTITEDSLEWDLLTVVDYIDTTIETVEFTQIDFTVAPMEGAKLLLSIRDGIEDGMYVAGFTE